MEFRVTNGSAEKLTGLRVQMCVMLAGLTGFDAADERQQGVRRPVRRVQGRDRQAVGHHRLGAVRAGVGQPAVPVPARRPGGRGLPPGESRSVRGWLSFYEGADIDAELKRLSGVAFP